MQLIDGYEVGIKDDSKKIVYGDKYRTAYKTLPEAMRIAKQIKNRKPNVKIRILKETKEIIKEMK